MTEARTRRVIADAGARLFAERDTF